MPDRDPWPAPGYQGPVEPAPSRRRKRRGGDAPSDDGRPVIQIRQGDISQALEEAEAALLAVRDARIYQRGGMIVQVGDLPARRADGAIEPQLAVVPAAPAAVAEAMALAATFQKFDGRSNDWRTVDPPARLIEAYTARSRWRLPVLRQIVTSPIIRTDGALLNRSGFDPKSGLFFADNLPAVDIPARPTKRDAEDACDRLEALVASFPFVDETSKAVALAALLTAVQRSVLPTAPLFGIDAPAPGSGKTHLADTIAMAATGKRIVGLATNRRIEEFEKAFGAELMQGRGIIALDNLTAPLDGALLAMAITSPRVSVRVLGRSQTVDCPTSVTLIATANNIRVAADLARRVLICRLDAEMEFPEQRRFDGDPLVDARTQRSELLSAALTLIRWGIRNRDPAPQSSGELAGFDQWVKMICRPLQLLGRADPLAAMEKTRAVDVETGQLRDLVTAWADVFEAEPQTCGGAIAAAMETDHDGSRSPSRQRLADALAAVTGDRQGAINARRLSNYLARVAGRIVEQRRFVRGEKENKTMTWQVEQVPQNRRNRNNLLT